MISVIIMSAEQKQELRKRIKTLQAEIVDRTRNYLYQHTQSKGRKMLPLNSIAIQTENLLSHVVHPDTSFSEKNGNVEEEALIDFSPKTGGSKSLNDSPSIKKPQFPKSEGAKEKTSAQSKEALFNEMQNRIIFLSQEKEQYRQKQEQSEKIIESLRSLNNISAKSYCDPKDETEQEKNREQIQIFKEKADKLEKRCDIITKALDESEEANYKLRLQIQQLDLTEKKHLAEEKEKYQKKFNDLKNKIQQMEIMKKEYLRAYSKMKEEKENLEQCIRQGGNNSQQKSLNVINESNEQYVDEKIRQSCSDNRLVTIKNFLQRSLLQSSRSQMEKWITSSISKLEFLEDLEQEKREVQIEKLHSNYRKLIQRIGKQYKQEVTSMQSQFQNAMHKFMEAENLKSKTVEATLQKISPQKVRRGSFSFIPSPPKNALTSPNHRNSTNQISKNLNPLFDEVSKEESDESIKTAERNWELVCKLSDSQTKLMTLQKKYDYLIFKIANSNSEAEHKKTQTEFKHIMEKMIESKAAMDNERDMQPHFPQICSKVFEIISKLPVGNHQEALFAPSSFEELLHSLEVLQIFAEQYDSINEQKSRDLDAKLEKIKQIMQEILRYSEISPEVLNQLVRKSLTEQDSLVSNIMGEIITNRSILKRSNVSSMGSVVTFGKNTSHLADVEQVNSD